MDAASVDMEITTTLEEAGSARSPARIRIVEVADQESIRKGLVEVARARLPPGASLSDVNKMAASVTRTTTWNCSVDVRTGIAVAVTIEALLGREDGQVRDVNALTIVRVQ